MTYLTVKQAADFLNVTDGTIRNWIREGVFPAYQVNPGGRILLKSSDIEKAIDQKKIIVTDILDED